MKRDQEERTISTADLADRDPDEADLSSREETDGRNDQIQDGTDAEGGLGRESAAADSRPIRDEDPSSTVEGAGTISDLDGTSPLFDQGDAQHFQGEWEAIQNGFVDEPRRAVERADTLVADLMQRLAASFAHERKQLEAQWDRGDDVSTEDLRLALQRYRSFFGRLLQA
jgi:hypothetical protein